MIGDVIEVYGDAGLLMKLDAFDTNLVELFRLAGATLAFEHEDAILLVWFILLCHDDLLKTQWLQCPEIDHLLLVAPLI